MSLSSEKEQNRIKHTFSIWGSSQINIVYCPMFLPRSGSNKYFHVGLDVREIYNIKTNAVNPQRIGFRTGLAYTCLWQDEIQVDDDFSSQQKERTRYVVLKKELWTITCQKQFCLKLSRLSPPEKENNTEFPFPIWA